MKKWSHHQYFYASGMSKCLIHSHLIFGFTCIFTKYERIKYVKPQLNNRRAVIKLTRTHIISHSSWNNWQIFYQRDTVSWHLSVITNGNVNSIFPVKSRMNIVLNGHTSRFYYINAWVCQISFLQPNLFLFFINDFPHDISSRIGIYMLVTTV